MESIKDSDHGIKIGFSKMDAESEVHMESFVESDIRDLIMKYSYYIWTRDENNYFYGGGSLEVVLIEGDQVQETKQRINQRTHKEDEKSLCFGRVTIVPRT